MLRQLLRALVVVLMPFGVILDYYVYPNELGHFLKLRLLCSFLVGGVWLLHGLPFARKHYPWVGMPIVILWYSAPRNPQKMIWTSSGVPRKNHV